MSKNKVYASIITIGDELLIGQTIDTNSAWMAKELNNIGVWVKRRVAVGDVKDDIWNALNEELSQSEIVLITGGLGPTADDITKPLLCEYFNGKMIVNEEALMNVTNIAKKFKRPLLESNRKQAEVPDVCQVIQNKKGSAPGMVFNKDGRIIISMPGVPHEMMGMFNDDVIPKLPTMFSLPLIEHRTLVTAGIAESLLAERIKDFEKALPSHIKLAYLPNFSMVRLRLTSGGINGSVVAELDKYFTELQKTVSDVIVTNEDIPLEEVVGRLLIQRNATISFAESCTGGFISHLVTSLPGSSAYFAGSIISYSNNVKKDTLGVLPETLDTYGAVSESVVMEMAKGVQKTLQTTYGLAVSGIMGPGGGTEDKPVGTVWMAVCNDTKILTKKFEFRYNRKRNIENTAMAAFNLLRLFIIGKV